MSGTTIFYFIFNVVGVHASYSTNNIYVAGTNTNTNMRMCCLQYHFDILMSVLMKSKRLTMSRSWFYISISMYINDQWPPTTANHIQTKTAWVNTTVNLHMVVWMRKPFNQFTLTVSLLGAFYVIFENLYKWRISCLFHEWIRKYMQVH